jgi:hypothetical protein
MGAERGEVEVGKRYGVVTELVTVGEQGIAARTGCRRHGRGGTAVRRSGCLREPISRDRSDPRASLPTMS